MKSTDGEIDSHVGIREDPGVVLLAHAAMKEHVFAVQHEGRLRLSVLVATAAHGLAPGPADTQLVSD